MAIPTEIATPSDHVVLIQDDDELSVVSFEFESDEDAKQGLDASVVSLDPFDDDFVHHSSGRWDESNSNPDLMSASAANASGGKGGELSSAAAAQTLAAAAAAQVVAAAVKVEERKTQPRRKNAPRRSFNISCSSILSNSSDGLSKLKRSKDQGSRNNVRDSGEDASMGLSSSRHEGRERTRSSLHNLRKSLSNRNLMNKAMEDTSMGLSSSRHSCRRSSLITPPQRPQRNDSMVGPRSKSSRNLMTASSTAAAGRNLMAAVQSGAPQRPQRIDSFGPGHVQQQMATAAAASAQAVQ